MTTSPIFQHTSHIHIHTSALRGQHSNGFSQGGVVQLSLVLYLVNIGKLHFAILNGKQRQWQSLVAIKCMCVCVSICAVQKQWCQNELSEAISAMLLQLLFQWAFSFRLSFSK